MKAHIVAVRPGHSLNSKLTAEIIDSQSSKTVKKGMDSDAAENRKSFILPEETFLDDEFLDVLPHRYPFVMIDKVIRLKETNL